MARRPISVFLILSGLVLTVLPLTAQESQIELDKSRSLLRQQMEVKLKEMEVSLEPETGDLGEQVIVKRKPKNWALTVAGDVGEVWSSNVFQDPSSPRTDMALTHNDSLTFNYRLMDELTFSSSARYSIYRYMRLVTQNFDAYSINGSLTYQLPIDVTLTTGVQWTTLHSPGVNDFAYEEADWNGSLTKVVPLTFAPWVRDKAAFFFGFQADVRRASPADFDKVEYAPSLGLSYLITEKISAMFFYRWQYQDYERYLQSERHDVNNLLSTNVSWSPLDWMAVSGNCSWTHNNSYEAARDYKNFTTGASVRLFWKF